MLHALFACVLSLAPGPLGPVVLAAQASVGALPDFEAAERKLAEAREELEEIAGPELLRADAPPVPLLTEEDVGLSKEEADRAKRLLGVDPEEWSAADREWVDGVVALGPRLRGALGAEGDEVAGSQDLAGHLVPILQATRVVALADRVALLEGEAARFVDGLELRQSVAERLFLQPPLLGPLFGNTVHVETLRDVRWAVGRRETSAETLERLDALLARWQLAVPDPAAVVALEGLSTLASADDLPGELGAGEEAAKPLLLGPMARDFADLARLCREESCAAGSELVVRRMKESDDPFRAVADMMMPNMFSFAVKLDGGATLTEVARAALALRLEALETGRYPVALDALPPVLAAARGAVEGLEYEPPGRTRPGAGAATGAGGARLRLTRDDVLSGWSESGRAGLEPLLVWELPSPPAADDAG